MSVIDGLEVRGPDVRAPGSLGNRQAETPRAKGNRAAAQPIRPAARSVAKPCLVSTIAR